MFQIFTALLKLNFWGEKILLLAVMESIPRRWGQEGRCVCTCVFLHRTLWTAPVSSLASSEPWLHAAEGFPAAPWPESKGSWEAALASHVHSSLTHSFSGRGAGWTSNVGFYHILVFIPILLHWYPLSIDNCLKPSSLRFQLQNTLNFSQASI